MQPNGHSDLDPPDFLIDRWSERMRNGGYTGSLAEMEQACLKSKGYDNWSDYLLHIRIDGHFNQQKRKFWAHLSISFPAWATLKQLLVHYLATRRFGAWYIQKYLGMRGRIAA